MGKSDDGQRRDEALETLRDIERAGTDDNAVLARRFNEAATALRETGQYISDIARIARIGHGAHNPILRREAMDVLGAIAVEAGPYSATATTVLAVALEGGAAAAHPDGSLPDSDAGVRLRACVWLGQIGRKAPEGLEAFNCFMALSYAAKNDPDKEARLAAIVGLGNIGRAKLLTWAEDVVESLRDARDEKFPAALKLIDLEVGEIIALRQELLMRLAGMGGGASPHIS